jgi:hypothetical protein
MGLLGGIARTAVIAGTATAVSNRVSRRQGERWAQEEQSAYAQPQYAEQAPAPAAESTLDQLTKLGQLHDSGVLTDDEFAAQKAKILG